MNCRPGDLAVVIRADAPQNIGVLVTILEAHAFPGCWYVEVHGRAVAANDPARRPAGANGRRVRAWDVDLRPIRGDGVSDQEVSELYSEKAGPRELANGEAITPEWLREWGWAPWSDAPSKPTYNAIRGH